MNFKKTEIFFLIIQEWKKFTPELCDRLMSSIGKRLQAVINKNGEHVLKSDYEWSCNIV